MTIYSLDVFLFQFGTSPSIVPCLVLTVVFWPAYWFLRRWVRWSGIPISLRIFTVCCDPHKGFIVNEAEIYVFLEFSCIFCDPKDVGNLISGSSAFSKSNLNIWKFLVRVLLKPQLENFEHNFASKWDECNCAVVWAFYGLAFLWDWNEKCPFQSCDHCWVFQIWWHIECSILTASSFRIWNNSTGNGLAQSFDKMRLPWWLRQSSVCL